MVYTPLTSQAGMNTDNLDGNIPQGFLTFAQNAVITSFDRSYVSYSTEQGNDFCVKPPDGFTVLGKYNITQQNRVILFLVGENGNGQIGELKDCKYTPIITSSCLNFDLHYPIHQIAIKNTNCSTELYWTDAYNSMRFINLDDLPFKEIPDPNNDYKKIKIEGEVDCNKMLIQSNFSIPTTNVVSVEQGGILKEGVYQFGVAYSNELGETYSPFFNVTNTVPIKEKDRLTQNFDTQTDQAIRVSVENLDTTGIFDYFVLIVAETINAITTFKQVGIYPIASESYDTLYTGQTATAIQLTAEQIFQQFQYYDLAEGVTQSDDRLIFYGVKEKQKINYQPIWSKVRLNWETHKLPYTQTEGYNNPLNTLNLKGYMRDEVYPIEGAFILRNGKTTDSFHIPGRLPLPQDLENVPISNLDSNSLVKDPCDTSLNKKYWQVYNTGSVTANSNGYNGNENNDCYKGVYQYGEFSYWQSEELYPNNSDIWGDLANKPIRHHKFPDELVTPRFTSEGDKNFIYPIGIKLDIGSLRDAINNSDLTDYQKEEIIGFKIIRGKREAGNQSVKAKGYTTNVGKYEYEDQEYFFPNYPYNSLDVDPLFAEDKIKYGSGFNFDKVRKPFKDGQGKDQFTFHSPDTHFGRAAAIDQGYLKVEAIDYGKGKGHFVPIKANAEYKFLTPDATKAAIALASGVAFDFSKSGRPQFNGTDAIAVYSNASSLFEKLVAYQNFGYSINSQATFNKSFAVPNNGNKIRGIEYGKYLRGGGIESVEDGLPLNNYLRESSVYIKTNNELLYATEYSPLIPSDTSRLIATINNNLVITPEDFYELLKTGLSVAVLTALILGIRSAAKDVLPDNENATTVLSQMISLILDPIINTQPFSGLESLKGQAELCSNVAAIYPTYNINYSESNPLMAGQMPSPQNVDVYNSQGELISGGTANTGAPTFTITNNVPSITANQTFTISYIKDTVELTADQDLQIVTTDNNARSIIGAVLYGIETPQICGGKLLEAAYNAIVYGAEAYKTTSEDPIKKTLSNFREFDVNAYYTSLKSYLPAQWGRMYSYTTVDTGYYQPIEDEPTTIFGGDTFINKFSLKTKLSVFNKSTVNLPNGADIALDEEGNLGDPMFWISTKPITYQYKIDEDALSSAFAGIGLVNKNALWGSIGQQVGLGLMTAGGVLAGIGAASVVGIPVLVTVGVITAAVGGAIYIVSSIFKNVGNKITKAVIKLYKDLFQQLIDTIGVKNINLDMATRNGLANQGIFYQYVYGLPTFFVESQVNVDFRQATNDNEGNFYPNVGEGVPDDWLQQARVPIEQDNNYTYNKSYSKQNNESFYTHLREDFDPTKLCYSEFPNRAIWSEKTNLNETLNNWLIYKPVNRFDFPKSYGKLTALDGISNGVVLARYENKTQLYNALSTVNTTTFQAYLGNDTLFSTPPLDFSETDGGSLGSQHKFLLRTKNGNIFVDALRGQVMLYRGEQPQIISDLGMSRWFSENLPFKIDKYFDISTDNNFGGVGIHGVYDQEYERVIITKLDYEPKNSGITYENNSFFLQGREVQLTDERYFCNKSWTLSFSFLSNSWISYHSYKPNFYIGYPNTFQSGSNNGIYTHNTNYTNFHTYYGKVEPYILEYPLTYNSAQDQVIQSVSDYSCATIYQSKDVSYEPMDILYFDEVEVYNKNQHTGTRNLIPKPKNDLSALRKYPKYNNDSIDILVDKRDSWVSFNSLWDLVIDTNKPILDISCSSNLAEADQSNLDYTRKPYKNILLRGKNARIRLTLNKNNFKLTSRLVLAQSTISNA